LDESTAPFPEERPCKNDSIIWRCLLAISVHYLPRFYDISFIQKHLDYGSNFDGFEFDHFIARLIRVAGKVQKDAALGDLISRFHLPLDQLATTLRIGEQNVFCDHFSLFISWAFFSKARREDADVGKIARRRQVLGVVDK
jgi:hypothetical protein